MTAMHNGAAGSYAGIVLAAGSGTRVGHSGSKAYLPLAGRSVLVWALETLAGTGGVERLVLAVRDQDLELAGEVLERELPGVGVDLVAGGPTRHESEHRALRLLAGDIRRGAIAAVLLDDAARLLPGDGERLVSIQTPQAFRAAPLLDAYEAAARDGFAGTDTAACIERYTDLEVAVVPGEPGNLKITFADDLLIAERLLRRQAPGGVSPARSRPGRARPGRGSR